MGYEPTVAVETFEGLRRTAPHGTVSAGDVAAFVLGRTFPGDGYGGLFYWASGVSEADDNLNTLQSRVAAGGVWKRGILAFGPGVQAVSSSGGVVSINALAGRLFALRLTDNTTINAPTGGIAGSEVTVAITQDSGNNYSVVIAEDCVMDEIVSVGPGRTTILKLIYNGSAWVQAAPLVVDVQ